MTTFTFDKFGHQLTRTLPALPAGTPTETNTYDAYGRLATHTDVPVHGVSHTKVGAHPCPGPRSAWNKPFLFCPICMEGRVSRSDLARELSCPQ